MEAIVWFVYSMSSPGLLELVLKFGKFTESQDVWFHRNPFTGYR